MSNQAWKAVVDRKPILHRPDCDGLDPGEAALPTADALSRVASEAAVRYGLAVRPHYEVLKRTLGQLSGFLILVYGSRRPDVLDIEAVAATREQFAEANEGLRSLQPPEVGSAHHRGLLQAAALLEGALALLTHKDLQRSEEKRSALGERLNAAHRLILAASDPRFAMTMVDFSHACCSCASPPPGQDQSHDNNVIGRTA
ncbi:MAG: hypothetical protein Kilf2KO_13460 [Rhodospirillales bacterium]